MAEDNPIDDDKVVENKNSLSYPSSTLDPPFSIVEQAKEIEMAEDFLKNRANSKLEIIAEQIRRLKKEAREVIEEAHSDMELHKVKCNFEKRIGEVIYLYKKDEDEMYFSRISPEEWNGNPPHSFMGKYRMNFDRSFEKLD